MISYSTEMRRVGRAVQSLIDPNEMTRWVISDSSDPRPRCRLYPRKRPQKRTSTGAFFQAANAVSNQAPLQNLGTIQKVVGDFGPYYVSIFEMGSTEPEKYMQRGQQMRPLSPGIGIGGWRPYWLADDAV